MCTQGGRDVKLGVVLLQAEDLPEAGRVAWNRSSPVPSEGVWPCRHVDLSLVASRTVRQ